MHLCWTELSCATIRTNSVILLKFHFLSYIPNFSSEIPLFFVARHKVVFSSFYFLFIGVLLIPVFFVLFQVIVVLLILVFFVLFQVIVVLLILVFFVLFQVIVVLLILMFFELFQVIVVLLILVFFVLFPNFERVQCTSLILRCLVDRLNLQKRP